MEDILLGSSRLFYLFLAGFCDACHRDKFIIYLVYYAGAQDDLELAGSFKDAFYTINIFNDFFVTFLVAQWAAEIMF